MESSCPSSTICSCSGGIVLRRLAFGLPASSSWAVTGTRRTISRSGSCFQPSGVNGSSATCAPRISIASSQASSGISASFAHISEVRVAENVKRISRLRQLDHQLDRVEARVAADGDLPVPGGQQPLRAAEHPSRTRPP